MLKELGEKFKKNMWGWIWTEAGKQPELEEAFGMGGFGYPAMAAVNYRKMKFSMLKVCRCHLLLANNPHFSNLVVSFKNFRKKWLSLGRLSRDFSNIFATWQYYGQLPGEQSRGVSGIFEAAVVLLRQLMHGCSVRQAWYKKTARLVYLLCLNLPFIR